MGIPTSDGPDFIINRLRNDVTLPWSRPLAAAIAGAWFLFALIPWLFGEQSGEMVARWSGIALIALVLTFAIPIFVGNERYRASIGVVAGAAALIAVVWVATA